MSSPRAYSQFRIRPGSAVLIALAATVACDGGGSRQDLLACASPSEATLAVFFREYGGGAGGWQYEHVALRARGSTEEKVAFEMAHGYDVVLEWTAEDALVIQYPEEATVFNEPGPVTVQLAGGDRPIQVTATKKLSRDGSFINDKLRCAGLSREVPLLENARPIERPIR